MHRSILDLVVEPHPKTNTADISANVNAVLEIIKADGHVRRP